MIKTIENLLKDHHGHHSDFQVEHFIIGSAGDTWARYKQCLREIESRYEIILSEREMLREQKADIEAFRIVGPGDKKRHEKMKLAYFKKLNNAKDILRELALLVKLGVELKSKIGEIDTAKRQRLESQSWKDKALKMAGIDLLAVGRVSQQTLDFILSLPKADTTQVMTQIRDDGPFKLLGLEEPERGNIDARSKRNKSSIAG